MNAPLYSPIYLIYWVVLGSKYVCLKDWSDDIRKTAHEGTGLQYPLKEAVELIEKYWTGNTNGSIFR